MRGCQDNFLRSELPIEDWVLLVVDNMPDKTLHDRHNFQNKMYFLSILCQTDFDFGPHYFGPYSSLLASAIDMMVHLRFLKEVRERLPRHQMTALGSHYTFIYEMDEGSDVMELIYDKANPMGIVEIIKKVIAITQDVDSKIQSSACKCHFGVYYQQKHKITPQLMRNVMKGWGSHDVKYKDMSDVIALLEALGLDRR